MVGAASSCVAVLRVVDGLAIGANPETVETSNKARKENNLFILRICFFVSVFRSAKRTPSYSTRWWRAVSSVRHYDCLIILRHVTLRNSRQVLIDTEQNV